MSPESVPVFPETYLVFSVRRVSPLRVPKPSRHGPFGLDKRIMWYYIKKLLSIERKKEGGKGRE